MGQLREDVTWAAVFDGGRARLFRCQSAKQGQSPLVALELHELDNPRAHEQGRDKPGRAHTPSGGRSAHESDDPHQQAQARFVRDFAGHVETQAKAGAFDGIVLVAPSQWLACFRDAAPEAAKRILAEDAADLTKAPMLDLARRVERLLKPWL